MKNKFLKIFIIFIFFFISVGVVSSFSIPSVVKITGSIDLTETNGTYVVYAFVNDHLIGYKYYSNYDDLRLGLYNGFFSDPFDISKTGDGESYSFVLSVSRTYIVNGIDYTVINNSDPILFPNPNYSNLSYTVDIVDSSITTPKIKDNAVGENDLGANSIWTVSIPENVVTTNKIKNDSIKGTDFSLEAIVSEKVADNTIEKPKLKIEPSNPNTTYSEFLAKTENDNFSWVSNVSEDYEFAVGQGLFKAFVTMSNTTYVGIGNEKVETGMFEDNSVTTNKIKDLAVTNPKLSDNSVSRQKIMADAIVTSKIQNQAVTNSKIKNKNINQDKLNNTEYYSLLKCGQTYYSVSGNMYDLEFDNCNINYNNSENKYLVTYNNILIKKDASTKYYFSNKDFTKNINLIKGYCNSRGGSLNSYTTESGSFNSLLGLTEKGELQVDSGTSKIKNIVCEFYYIEWYCILGDCKW